MSDMPGAPGLLRAGMIAPMQAEQARAAAALHAETMDDPWNEAAWSGFIADSTVIALCAIASDRLLAVSLLRAVAGEAEVLTIAVESAARNRGIGALLLSEGLAEAVRRGAESAFLEVAVDNAAAFALYRRAGFVEIGRRSGYYRRPAGRNGAAVDALRMACRL
ncbi:GNAT family N-acetyltransferase [Microbaculum marinum]|uniref:GNAT family N-acetyltransferase n=2 Tax=Microbaculum marinum TaxID=1764581 RepID=A0AAW9RWT0_9HYPH